MFGKDIWIIEFIEQLLIVILETLTWRSYFLKKFHTNKQVCVKNSIFLWKIAFFWNICKTFFWTRQSTCECFIIKLKNCQVVLTSMSGNLFWTSLYNERKTRLKDTQILNTVDLSFHRCYLISLMGNTAWYRSICLEVFCKEGCLASLGD